MAKREGVMQWAVRYHDGSYTTWTRQERARQMARAYGNELVRVRITEIPSKATAKKKPVRKGKR